MVQGQANNGSDSVGHLPAAAGYIMEIEFGGADGQQGRTYNLHRPCPSVAAGSQCARKDKDGRMTGETRTAFIRHPSAFCGGLLHYATNHS